MPTENDNIIIGSPRLNNWLVKIAALLAIGLLACCLFKWLSIEDTKPIPFATLQAEYALTKLLPDRIKDSDYYAGISIKSEIYQGQKAYDERLFQLAIQFFERTIKLFPERFDLVFYTGLAYLHLGNKSRGMAYMRQIIDHPDKPFHRNKALWFTALVYLESFQLPKCEAILDQLIALESNNGKRGLYREAVTLRRKLDRVGG